MSKAADDEKKRLIRSNRGDTSTTEQAHSTDGTNKTVTEDKLKFKFKQTAMKGKKANQANQVKSQRENVEKEKKLKQMEDFLSMLKEKKSEKK